MVIFLNFDGVLHPFLERSGVTAFCYMPLLEKVLREFPVVQIMIASTQREFVPLPLLKEQFASDIAGRIAGATPVHQIRDAGDVAGSRYREILAYLNGSGAGWLSLDDDASLFPLGCAELEVIIFQWLGLAVIVLAVEENRKLQKRAKLNEIVVLFPEAART